eukprot:scaffold12191_cov126-Isochrysis_galbana.AAC.5
MWVGTGGICTNKLFTNVLSVWRSRALSSSNRPSNPPPLQAGSCQMCRSMKGEGDRGLGEIGESECQGRPQSRPPHRTPRSSLMHWAGGAF